LNVGDSQILALQLTKQGGERVRALAAASPFVKLLSIESSLEEFERKALQIRPQVLLVEYDPENRGLIDLLERLRISVSGSAVVALSNSKEPEHIIRAVRLGVREYLAEEPDSIQAFKEAILRIRMPTQVSEEPKGRLFGVIGSKGGVGTSHLAINLAWAFSQVMGQRVALVDLDMSGGNEAFLLDLEPKRDWTDVAQNFERLDAVLLDSLLLEVAPGFRLLAAPDDPVEAEEVRPNHVGAALDFLARSHAFVVIDLGSGLDDLNLVAIDRCEQMLMVLEPTVVGLKAAARLVSLSQRLGHEKERIRPLVNRADSRGSILPREVEAVLNREVVAWLPNQYPALAEAANIGRPVLSIDSKCKWSKAVMELATKLANETGESG